MASRKSLPTRAEVVDAIRDSGYPLELAVTLAAERANFDVTPNWIWWDDREKARHLREVDLACTSRFYDDSFSLQMHLLIECKAYRAGVVVFETVMDRLYEFSSIELDAAHSWGQPSAILSSLKSHGGSPFASVLRWGTQTWAPPETIGTQFGVVQERKDKNGRAWKLDHGDGHLAVDGLMHGLLAFRSEVGQIVEGSPDAYMNLAALALVVEGPIYRYRSFQPAARAGLKQVKRATLLRRSGMKDRRYIFRIDIVHRSALPAYLAGLRQDGRAMLDILRGVRHLLPKSVLVFGNTRATSP